MMYYRIYTPAREQGLYTKEEMVEKYGKRWRQITKKFRIEQWDSDTWFKKSFAKV